MTSVPGSDADQTPTVGQTIDRWWSSSRRTDGRTVAKSVNGSGSISARGWAAHDSTIVRSALDAASPASFQPVNAATSTGRLRLGSASQRTCSVPTTNTLPVPGGSVSES